MSERIDGDVRNCLPCDFLTQSRKGPMCNRTGRNIEFIEECSTGPMATVPNRGMEMHEYIEKAQLKWRIQGEKHERIA